MTIDDLHHIKAFIFDMDGVLYRGSSRLPGSRRLLRTLQRAGVPYVLLTNNSTRTVNQYVEKLSHLGIDAAPEQIITSAVATGLYLAERAAPGTPMYAVGMDGLHEALWQQGFRLTDESAEYVVVGFDSQVTYAKLSAATLAIRAGATFIGTNPDRTIPTERGLEPGAGSILAAIEAATDVSPTIIGKPQRRVFETALKKLGARPAETAMVGDRLETDILGGLEAGLHTILVLTGVTSRDGLAGSAIQPSLVLENLETLLSAWSDNA